MKRSCFYTLYNLLQPIASYYIILVDGKGWGIEFSPAVFYIFSLQWRF